MPFACRDMAVKNMLTAVDMSAFDGINEKEFEVMWKNQKSDSIWTNGVQNILAGI